MADFLLASGSPRRRDYLTEAGYRFAVIAAAVEEIPQPQERAHDYALRVAHAKALAGFLAAPVSGLPVVLAADTDVVIDGQILGKPEGFAQAEAMLRQLSNRSHEVVSAVVLRTAHAVTQVLTVTEVEVCALSHADITAYLNSGEPFGKAGSYAIQGRFARYIRRIHGSYTGVVGLPMAETAELLAEAGIFPQG